MSVSRGFPRRNRVYQHYAVRHVSLSCRRWRWCECLRGPPGTDERSVENALVARGHGAAPERHPCQQRSRTYGAPSCSSSRLVLSSCQSRRDFVMCCVVVRWSVSLLIHRLQWWMCEWGYCVHRVRRVDPACMGRSVALSMCSAYPHSRQPVATPIAIRPRPLLTGLTVHVPVLFLFSPE